MPCCLVYVALALAATAGDVSKSALTMLAFGLGTLPAVMGVGIITNVCPGYPECSDLKKLSVCL